MKKIIKNILFIVVAVILFGFNNVSAMSESELESKLTKAYVINGTTFQVDSSQKIQIERYLKQNEISSSDADKIAAKVDEAVKVIEASNAKSISALDKNTKNKLISIANDVSNTTSVKISVSDGAISVYNTDGTLFTKIEDSVVKQTNNNNIIIVTSLVSLVGIAFIAINILKKNE
jgi:hypothetical protein